ncbi:Sporulation kinase E [compost metagenome]
MERQQIGQAMSGLSAGSFKLSHALKNQISKLKVYGLIIRKIADESENVDLRMQSDRMLNVSEEMLLMMNRIEMQSNAIGMIESEIDVGKMMDSVVESFDLTSEGISIDKEYPFPALLKCDDVHMKEVLNNLFTNAIDAMDGINNRLWLGYYETGRTFVIYVKDNGCGIPKQDIRKVIQPFYTTKLTDSHHFGMGLSYCYFVVSRHQGEIRIISEAGRGTEVQLRFKRSRLVSK